MRLKKHKVKDLCNRLRQPFDITDDTLLSIDTQRLLLNKILDTMDAYTNNSGADVGVVVKFLDPCFYEEDNITNRQFT